MTVWSGVAVAVTGWLLAFSSPAAADVDDAEFLIAASIAWLEELEARHRPAGRPLTPSERRTLDPYFEPELLEAARIVVVDRLENPGFYRRYVDAGRPIPIDFGRMSGLSLVDTVLVVESRLGPGWLPLLFHELVHVAQNRVLGFERATATYVEAFLEHGSYRAIPHEAQAHELAARFHDGGRPFSVEAEVERRFRRP